LQGLVQLRDGDLQTRHGQQWVSDNEVDGSLMDHERLQVKADWQHTPRSTSQPGRRFPTLPESMSSSVKGQPQGGTADRAWSGSWVTDDDTDEVKVDRQMLDKLLAIAGATLAKGCYATLPYTATTSWHQMTMMMRLLYMLPLENCPLPTAVCLLEAISARIYDGTRLLLHIQNYQHCT